ncbi:MAG TPA: T9SS type A sorting domain-containing protein, partial [Bacteroidales bacterium]
HQANTTGFVAQKVLDDGTVAWDEDGNLICTTTYSPFYEEHVEVQTGDKTIAVWAKTQAGGGSNDIYITRVDDNEVSGEKELARKQFQVYPNPATSEFTIVLPENLNDASISLIDSFGKEVFRTSQSSFSTNQRLIISTAELPAGIYFVRIRSSGDTYSEKVVVN